MGLAEGRAASTVRSYASRPNKSDYFNASLYAEASTVAKASTFAEASADRMGDTVGGQEVSKPVRTQSLAVE